MNTWEFRLQEKMTVLGVRGIHSCMLGVVSLTLSCGLLSGCGPGDECSMGQSHCDGDVAMNCQSVEGGYGTYYHWQSSSCRANSCKLSSAGFAFCAASPNPDPRCVGLREAVCDGKTMRSCEEGYTADPGTVCVLCNEFDANPSMDHDFAGAVCIEQAPPNPNCPSAPVGSGISDACDGNDRLRCEEGLVVSRHPCGTGFCVGIGQCALSKDPDPNCLPNEPAPSFCEANTAVTCDYGYRVAENPCPAGEVCMNWTAPCRSPADTSCTIALCVAQ